MEMTKNGQVELLNMKGGKHLDTPTVCGIGYIGYGEYRASIKRKHTLEYDRWKGMLRRCYDEKERSKNITYENVTVCEEWYNFQNFAKWFHQNYYEIEGERMHLDKDILYKGNKLYSPDNCVFVPQYINSLFTKSHKVIGNLPIGVNFDNKRNKYRAYCCVKRKLIAIGNNYITPEDAFYNGYKPFKESYIKEMAGEYKDRIPKNLYNAMINWKVEITD